MNGKRRDGNNLSKKTHRTLLFFMAFLVMGNVITQAATTINATLEHTGSTYYMNGETYTQSCDKKEERYANQGGKKAWTGQAAMKFSFTIPAGKTVTSATLTWSTYIYRQNNGDIRNCDFYYMNPGKDIDWNALANGNTGMIMAMSGTPYTYFKNERRQDGQEYLNIESDVTTAVKAVESQGYVTIFLTNCASSADLYGKNSNYPPSLRITYADKRTVTFVAGDNATCATTSLSCVSDGGTTSVTLPEATDDNGATFMGWYTAPFGGTHIGKAGNSYTPSGDITLYAQYDREPTSIAITGASEIKYGATESLAVTLSPSNTIYGNITWSSDNNDIATVDQKGVVTARALGHATITAKAANNISTTHQIDVESDYYGYTVNAVDNSNKILKQLKSDTYATGTGVKDIAYPRYVLVDSILYEKTRNIEGNWWGIGITPATDNSVYNIVYTPAISNVVFFTEAEDCDALGTKHDYPSRASNGSMARNASSDTQYREVTTLVPGTYTLYARGIAGNANNQICNFKVGNQNVASLSFPNGTDRYAQSQPFTLTETSTLYINCPMGSQSGLDYFYLVQDRVYHVTQNLQQFNFSKENIDGTLYTTANPINNSGNNAGTRNGVSGPFYNIKNTGNYVTITVDGAIAFSIDAFHGNSKETRTAHVFVDGNESVEFSVPPGEFTTSPIIVTGSTGRHTIKITGDGKDIYPVDIVFYTEKVVPMLNFTTAAVKVGETKELTLRLPHGCTFSSMTDSGDASKVTASFTRDDSDDSGGRKGTLTLTGLHATGNTPTSITFGIISNDADVYMSGTGTITIDVLKSSLTLAYSDGDSGDDATEYVCNADDTTPVLPSLTLTATDENGTPVDLNTLSLSFDSEDETVATVSNSGAITLTTPYGNGSTVIRATATSENYDDAEAEYSITIQKGVNWKVSTHPVFKNTAPAVRDTFHVYENVGGEEKLYLIGTFGGWNRNGNKYNYPQTNGTPKQQTDSWGKKTSASTGVDGFSTYWSGALDASNETMYSSLQQYYNDVIYGVERFGWFKQPDGDMSHPFTLPVRGAYVTFEPKVNGTLSVYIDQNGSWNSKRSDIYDNDGNLVSADANGNAVEFPDAAPFQFRPHAFFIVDQNGNLVDNYTPVNIITRTKVKTGISTATNKAVLDTFCANYACEKGEKFKCIIDEYADGYNDVTNIGNWKEFKEYMSPGEQQRVHDNWSAGVNGAQVITKLDNGAYLAIDKGMVKYTFHVVAGQTYYVFSNFSKIGFAGCNFVPDEQNQPSGILALSEDEKYNPADLKEPEGNNTVPMYATITLDRSFTAGNWNTICLPFTMTEREVVEVFGEGTELIILDRVNVDAGHASIYMTYHEIQSILAGYPYLIKPTQDVDHIDVHNKAIDPRQEVLEFSNNGYTSKGVDGFCDPQTYSSAVTGMGSNVTASAHLTAGDIYLSSNTLYISRGKSFLKGYRSYLKKDIDVAPAKAVSFGYYNAWDDDYEENTTFIDVKELTDEAQQSLGLKPRGSVHSLTGQKMDGDLSKLPHGIYIIDGRKTVVE